VHDLHIRNKKKRVRRVVVFFFLLFDSPHMSVTDLEQMIPVILGSAMVYGALFFILKVAIMPRSKLWRELPERHKVEWIMRVIATINGGGCGVASLFGIFDDYRTADLSPYVVVCLISLGYFIYDGIGNIVYYKLLHKSYILFHHGFCFLAGLTFVYSGHISMALVGLFTLLPDPIDHILWFMHRMHFPDGLRKMGNHANTAFFLVNRLVIGNMRFYDAFFVDPVVAKLATWQLAVHVAALVVFLGMNIRVGMQRVFKKPRGHPVDASPSPSPVKSAAHKD
jgi:hypothetical protein